MNTYSIQLKNMKIDSKIHLKKEQHALDLNHSKLITQKYHLILDVKIKEKTKMVIIFL